MSAPPFELFLRAHRDSVYRYLRCAVGPGAADDCFQETFLAALRAYPPAHDGNLRGWALTIAHRQAIAHHRRRGRAAAAVDEVPDGGTSDTLPDPSLWSALARLPDKQREAITLRYAADLPFAQVAAAMDTTEAAARQNVRAGLANLRQEYGDGEG